MDDQTLRPAVGSKEAGYLFEFREDGVYLTIYPDAADGLAFELSDIRQVLHDHGVIDYDIITLSQILREAAGEPRKLATSYGLPEEIAEQENQQAQPEQEKPVEEDQKPAGIIVDISHDKMIATIRYDTNVGRMLPTYEDVRQALTDTGVVFGIDVDAIRRGIESLSPFVAAKGQSPRHGENARIERHFDLGIKGRPKVDEYDRVDFKNMNLFVLAKKGDLLAVRIPQTQGEPGRDVYGREINARNGKPIPMPQGNNTEITGDNELIALIDGQIVDTGKKISVDPHLLIPRQRIPVDKVRDEDTMAKVGTCIHNIFCAIDQNHNEGSVSSAILAHNMQEYLTDAKPILLAWDWLVGFMTEHFGPAIETYHERPFKYESNGQITTGSIDLVWKTDKGCVVIDYKTYPNWSKESVTTKEDKHYAGKYKGQLDCYEHALSLSGENVIAKLIYYPVNGMIIQI